MTYKFVINILIFFLQTKLEVQEKSNKGLPQLMNSILADKNDEIDNLKEQLKKKDTLLEMYSCLNLDEVQIKELAKQNEVKTSARTLSGILSINSECEEEAIRESANITNSQNMSNFKLYHLQKNERLEEGLTDIILEASQVPELDLTCFDQENIQTNNQNVNTYELSSNLNMQSNINLNIIEQEDNDFICIRHANVDYEDNLINTSDLLTKISDRQIFFYKPANPSTIETISLHQKDEQAFPENRFYEEFINLPVRDKDTLEKSVQVSETPESKIRNDLEQMKKKLKSCNDDLKSYHEKIEINEKMLYEERQKYHSVSNLLCKQEQEMKKLTDTISEKDTLVNKLKLELQKMNSEIQSLELVKINFEATKDQLLKCQEEIKILNDRLFTRNQIIEKFQDMANISNCLENICICDDGKESRELEDISKLHNQIVPISDDYKNLEKGTKIPRNSIGKTSNVIKLRKKLKEEKMFNTDLQFQVKKIQKNLSKINHQNRLEDKVKEVSIEKQLDFSATFDEQLLHAMKNEPHKNFKIQADADDEKMNKYRICSEMDRRELKEQIFKYENNIIQLNVDMRQNALHLLWLQQEVARQQKTIHSLECQIKSEKKMAEESKKCDTELISQLRAKLDELLKENNNLTENLKILQEDQKNLQNLFTGFENALDKNQRLDEKIRLFLLDKFENKHKSITPSQDELDKAILNSNDLKEEKKCNDETCNPTAETGKINSREESEHLKENLNILNKKNSKGSDKKRDKQQLYQRELASLRQELFESRKKLVSFINYIWL